MSGTSYTWYTGSELVPTILEDMRLNHNTLNKLLAGERYVSYTAMVAHTYVRSEAVIMLLFIHCF